MANKKYDKEEGIWRTIGGRKVFIKTGQSLSDAMKESGKFKKTSDVKRGEYQKLNAEVEKENARYNDDLKHNERSWENYNKKAGKLSDREMAEFYAEQNPDGYKGLISRKAGKHIDSEKEKQLSDTFEVGDLKRKALETLPKDHIDSHEGDLYIKKTPQSTELLNRMKDKDSGLLSTFKDQQTGEEWYDVPFANMEDDYKEKYSHAFPFHKQTEQEKKYADDVAEYFKGKDIKEEVKRAKEEFNKSQKTGNDYLPKASKVMTSGTSNRKEVSDNIQAHILEYYDNPVDFMEQMDAVDYLPTRWKQGEYLAKGGSYLIYNGDMADYLDSLNINPKGKKFSEDKSFEMYTSLVGRESERLYNRLEKLYDQYKKEHKGSDVSLDDFRKWFK